MLVWLTGLMYVLHQDWWWWGEARPLVGGVLPVGLAYHAVYTLGCVGLMALLVKAAWPKGLE